MATGCGAFAPEAQTSIGVYRVYRPGLYRRSRPA
jgi:hypothetical protein